MHLKRIEIAGFKAFADRTSVDFVQGVTAVVGPNGSGKSNITDAIRWVLGEQSAKSLRGSKMEDIIFAGSDTRKPLNVAEVTLILENDDHFLPFDFHEVSITRRVYRSGESEFYINKQACRLKDIIDLFMDSGLGREAFSIISQGQVEEILSSKAEERRAIFEEAAGVLKYKTRKKKAEVKLLETEENLNRIEDILHEIEGQLEPLELQSSIAKDYLAKKEALEKIEVALIVYEIEKLHEQWQQLLKQLEEQKQKEMELLSNVQVGEAEMEALQLKMQKLDDSITALQDVLLRTSNELEKLDGQKEVLKERKKNAHNNQAQLEDTINHLTKKLDAYTADIKRQSNELSEQIKELKTLEENVEVCEQELAKIDHDFEKDMDELKSDYIELLNHQASLKNEKNHLQRQQQLNIHRKQRLDQENEKFLRLREELQQKKKDHHKKIAQLQTELHGQNKEYKQYELELKSKLEETQNKEKQLYKASQYLQTFKTRKEMLEDMKQDYSGFFQGVKEVLKAKLPGVKGAVAELLQVEQQYETAIEIALGSAMQYIVVDDEKNARNAILFLKRNKFGRATFLPISTMKEKRISDSQQMMLKNHDAFVGIASDLVSYERQYENIFSNLLGTVLISKDLKGANELARLCHHRFRIVSLEGDVVNPGGSMTGGAVKKKTSSLFTRQRELDDLNKKLPMMEQKTKALEQQVQALKNDIDEIQAQMGALKEEHDKLRLKEQQLQSEEREWIIEEKNINERLKIYDLETENLNKEKQDTNEKLLEIEKQIIQIDQRKNDLQCQIDALSNQKKNQQTSKEELQQQLTEWKIQSAKQNQFVKNKEENLLRLQTEKEQTEKELQAVTTELHSLKKEIDSKLSNEEELDKSVQQKKEEKERTLSSISSKRKERLQLQTKSQDMVRENKELKRLHKQMLDAIKETEVKVNRLDVELENKLNQLQEEYSLSFHAAKETYPLTLEVEEARQKVKLIKREIEELGTVNLGAIDEFKRISERYDFLTLQKNDLIEGKNTLHQVIQEMDEEMKKRFASSFYQIKEEFAYVFQQLFDGGKADLVLTSPEDMLQTGIDIIAQPPGKKLQNLALLSGGERALTAIALLFALLRVRPVPFCVLDEVEAALDDANVNRFASYLKKFSHDTQFIVITHRKGTMEEADVLYGVTMQESGVSKLVSVRLEDSKQLLEKSL